MNIILGILSMPLWGILLMIFVGFVLFSVAASLLVSLLTGLWKKKE